MTKRRKSLQPVFYGWCGTQYREGRLGASRLEKLQERVQVDPDQELEKIEVPKFGPNRPAVFVHDFKQVSCACFASDSLAGGG